MLPSIQCNVIMKILNGMMITDHILPWHCRKQVCSTNLWICLVQVNLNSCGYAAVYNQRGIWVILLIDQTSSGILSILSEVFSTSCPWHAMFRFGEEFQNQSKTCLLLLDRDPLLPLEDIINLLYSYWPNKFWYTAHLARGWFQWLLSLTYHVPFWEGEGV